jgi:hypothetical protein
LTTIVSWPRTVAATPLIKPTAEVKVDTPSTGGLVTYQLTAPVAAASAQHFSGLPVQLANMVRPSSPSMAQYVKTPGAPGVGVQTMECRLMLPPRLMLFAPVKPPCTEGSSDVPWQAACAVFGKSMGMSWPPPCTLLVTRET